MKTNKFKLQLLTGLAALSLALLPATGFCDASSGTGGNSATYGTGTIALPYTILPITTNISVLNGWTNTLTSSTTNITYTITNTASGFFLTTNVVTITNTTVVLPLVFCGFEKDKTIGMSFTASAAGTNTLVWARSLDGTPANAELNNEFSMTLGVAAAAGTPVTFYTNLPSTFIGGDGYVILVSNNWFSASGILTNGFGGAGIQYGIKRGAR